MTRKEHTDSPGIAPTLHPLVAATQRDLAQREPDKIGFCYSWGNCIRMRVSPSVQLRALRIADLVVRAIERRGFHVGVSKDGDVGVRVSTKAREVELVIREELKRFIHEPTPEEEAQAAVGDWFSRPPKYDWRPTGNIFVVFEAQFEAPIIVKEGPRRRQEDSIPRIVNSLIRMEQKAKDHDADLKHRLQEAERRRIAEEASETDEEREANLIEAMNAWQRANGIRAFVRAARKGLSVRTARAASQHGDLGRWVTWALAYADRIDPLVANLGDPGGWLGTPTGADRAQKSPVANQS